MTKPEENKKAETASKKQDTRTKKTELPDLGNFEFPEDYDVFEDDELIMMP